ncbi:MAG: hypothetical protein RLZ98_3536 [Pseudomonadota bacterium]
MNFKGRLARSIAALLFMQLQCAFARAADALHFDATARYLAGLAPTDETRFSQFFRESSWERHRAALDSSFGRLETETLARLRKWSVRVMPRKPPTLLYPFSGPDILFAAAMHPEARTYLMVGLEPIGRLPSIGRYSRSQRATALSEIRHSLRAILEYSFFRTKDMKEELASNTVSGVMPMLFVFLARSGLLIKKVELVVLGADGGIAPAGLGQKGGVPGVRIDFERRGEPRPEGAQTLYYLQADLSNNGLRRNGIQAFASSHGAALAFVKSASYLMHLNAFTGIRNLLVEQAQVIVQDDSGIPLRHIPRQIFEIKPYGAYLGPIDKFPDNHQRDMQQLFSGGRAVPIDFGIGYRWRPGQSNLIVATRRPVLADAEE